MLYLNRRGYAPLIICRSCGEKLKSPDTDSWLVEHRKTGRAMCHLTGFSMRMPTQCPNCAGGDPRAGERTYQTLVQVAGRAGRAAKKGRALIQTHQPEHEALLALAAGDRELFIGVELAMREMLGLPPFGKLAAVIISGPDQAKVIALAKKMVSLAPRADGIEGSVFSANVKQAELVSQ